MSMHVPQMVRIGPTFSSMPRIKPYCEISNCFPRSDLPMEVHRNTYLAVWASRCVFNGWPDFGYDLFVFD